MKNSKNDLFLDMSLVKHSFGITTNPMHRYTSFQFSLSGNEKVSLEIFDHKSELVCRLIDATMEAGDYKQPWTGVTPEGVQLKSGTYQVLMRIGSDSYRKKLSIIID
jgi:flagellar hook assembly protein FlgD